LEKRKRMKTSLEQITPVKKKLTVEIEAAEVDRRLAGAYRKVGKRAKIPGFRPGKIPKALLKRYFGDQVTDEVARNLINETFPRALEETKILPIGTPLLEKGSLEEGGVFTYSAEMEVRPEFEVKDYEGLEVQKEKITVSERDVMDRLEEIRRGRGRLKDIVEDRPVRDGDYVVINYRGFEGDEALEDIQAENFMIRVGSGDFHPEFESSLVGLEKGRSARFQVRFEESFRHSGLAGKEVRFEVEVLDIKEMEIPELDDEFAKSLDGEFPDLEALKNKVHKSITEEEERRTEQDLKRRILDRIGANADIALPDTLVETEVMYAVQNVQQSLARSGSSLDKAGLTEAKLREDFRPSAEKRVKDLLILGQIARQENISVSDDEVEERIENMAAEMGQDPEMLKKYYEARDLKGSLADRILEEKTLNYLVEHAKITEVEKGQLNQEETTEEEKR